MTTTLIVRLLDASGLLLAWASVTALAKGDQSLWATTPAVALSIEREGMATECVWHWPDLHVQQRHAVSLYVIREVEALMIDTSAPLMTFASDTGPLPAVTVGVPVRVSLPVGSFGARGM